MRFKIGLTLSTGRLAPGVMHAESALKNTRTASLVERQLDRSVRVHVLTGEPDEAEQIVGALGARIEGRSACQAGL